MKAFFFIHCLLPVHSEIIWTQYSDLASLPKSKRERDRLKDMISQIDEKYLSSPEDRSKLAHLRALLADDHVANQPDSQSPSRAPSLIAGLIIICSAVLWILKRPTLAAETSRPIDEEARQARLRRFEQPS